MTTPPVLDVEALLAPISDEAPSGVNPREDISPSSLYYQIKDARAQEHALGNSLVFGVYAGDKQIGLARIVSDYAVFAYLCDVFIHEDYRAHGLGKWLMETIMAHPDLQSLRRWLLATHDAHGLYKQYGWTPLENPHNWMEILQRYAGENG
jgi:GNAT superfamily N-acetyltransferase